MRGKKTIVVYFSCRLSFLCLFDLFFPTFFSSTHYQFRIISTGLPLRAHTQLALYWFRVPFPPSGGPSPLLLLGPFLLPTWRIHSIATTLWETILYVFGQLVPRGSPWPNTKNLRHPFSTSSTSFVFFSASFIWPVLVEFDWEKKSRRKTHTQLGDSVYTCGKGKRGSRPSRVQSTSAQERIRNGSTTEKESTTRKPEKKKKSREVVETVPPIRSRDKTRRKNNVDDAAKEPTGCGRLFCSFVVSGRRHNRTRQRHSNWRDLVIFTTHTFAIVDKLFVCFTKFRYLNGPGNKTTQKKNTNKQTIEWGKAPLSDHDDDDGDLIVFQNGFMLGRLPAGPEPPNEQQNKQRRVVGLWHENQSHLSSVKTIQKLSWLFWLLIGKIWDATARRDIRQNTSKTTN